MAKKDIKSIQRVGQALREGSYLGTRAVNIGSRQYGREMSKNVINVKYGHKKIINAVNKQIKKNKNPKSLLYGDGTSGRKISKILSETKLDIYKKLNYF